MSPPRWSADWTLFASWNDFPFALAGVVFCLLLILWWRQQSPHWFRLALATLLAALLLSIASQSVFVVPPHRVGCPELCDGWSGFPLPVAVNRVNGASEVGTADFALNVLLLWLLLLAASVAWRVAASFLGIGRRNRRWTIALVVLLVIVPWSLLPRILNPPQPQVAGEELRLANNARRAAEFTYGITGVWIHRLALEDVQRTVAAGVTGGAVNQICLRGYTFFFIPWRRYVITLDDTGATALSLSPKPLTGSCWD